MVRLVFQTQEAIYSLSIPTIYTYMVTSYVKGVAMCIFMHTYTCVGVYVTVSAKTLHVVCFP